MDVNIGDIGAGISIEDIGAGISIGNIGMGVSIGFVDVGVSIRDFGAIVCIGNIGAGVSIGDVGKVRLKLYKSLCLSVGQLVCRLVDACLVSFVRPYVFQLIQLLTSSP